MLVFLSDDVIRLRVSLRKNSREASYTLVTTAWEDRLDPSFEGERNPDHRAGRSLRGRGETLVFRTATLKLC